MTAYVHKERVYADTDRELDEVCARLGVAMSRLRFAPIRHAVLTPRQALLAGRYCRIADGTVVREIERRRARWALPWKWINGTAAVLALSVVSNAPAWGG